MRTTPQQLPPLGASSSSCRLRCRRGISCPTAAEVPLSLAWKRVTVDLKISFFVESAARTPTGWTIRGESGLGRPEPGDRFEVVVNEAESREDPVSLLVKLCAGDELEIIGSSEVAIKAGDILVGIAAG